MANSKLNPFTNSRDFRPSEIRGRDSRDSKSRKRTEARGSSSRRAGNKVDCAGGVNSNCRLNEQRQHARRKCASSATFIPLSRIKRKEGKKIKKKEKKERKKGERREKKRRAHAGEREEKTRERKKRGARQLDLSIEKFRSVDARSSIPPSFNLFSVGPVFLRCHACVQPGLSRFSQIRICKKHRHCPVY